MPAGISIAESTIAVDKCPLFSSPDGNLRKVRNPRHRNLLCNNSQWIIHHKLMDFLSFFLYVVFSFFPSPLVAARVRSLGCSSGPSVCSAYPGLLVHPPRFRHPVLTFRTSNAIKLRLCNINGGLIML